MTTWVYLLLMLALLCGSAFFSASEMALSSANRMRLASAAEEGNRAAAIACKVIDKYENALSAILIGNNLCNIGSTNNRWRMFGTSWIYLFYFFHESWYIYSLCLNFIPKQIDHIVTIRRGIFQHLHFIFPFDTLRNTRK